MQNSNQTTKDFGAMKLLQTLTNLSPLFIIGTMVMPLVIMGIIQNVHYAHILYPNLWYPGYFIAFLIAITTQTSRLAFGLAGARDMAQGKWWRGLIGLTATFAVAAFEQYEISIIAKAWSNTSLFSLLTFVNWLAVGAELRLMLSIPKSDNIQKVFQTTTANPSRSKSHPSKKASTKDQTLSENDFSVPLELSPLSITGNGQQ